MFSNCFNPIKARFIRKEKIMQVCKCPQCGSVAPDVENADWVVNGHPMCSMPCYDKTIQEMLEEMYQNGSLPTFDMAFHLG
jgi:formylmethanofuran dehydrogenase subunit E